MELGKLEAVYWSWPRHHTSMTFWVWLQVPDKHTGLCISTFHLFGCRLSEYKLALYDQCCKVLGVELDLCKSPTGALKAVTLKAGDLSWSPPWKVFWRKASFPDMRVNVCEEDSSLHQINCSGGDSDIVCATWIPISAGVQNCVARSWRHPSGSWSGCCKPIFSACGREFSRFGACVPWVVSVKLWCQGWSQTDQARRRRDGHIRAGRFSVCHGIESFGTLIREKKVVVFTCNKVCSPV